jgi:hypothetical protein
MEMSDCVVISSKPSIQSCTFNNTHSRGLMIFLPPSAVGKSSARLILEGIPHVQDILDDMIISAATYQQHLDNLEEVLSRLSKHGLKANSSKCEFFKERIEFCGHEISKLGLHKSQQKVDAVQNAPRLRMFPKFVPLFVLLIITTISFQTILPYFNH